MSSVVDETFRDSLAIASAATTLAANRCKDLGISPVFCFLIMQRLCEINAKEMDAQIHADAPDWVRKGFEDFRPILEKELGVSLKHPLDLQRALVDKFIESNPLKKVTL